jgi:hypothetical protein
MFLQECQQLRLGSCETDRNTKQGEGEDHSFMKSLQPPEQQVHEQVCRTHQVCCRRSLKEESRS